MRTFNFTLIDNVAMTSDIDSTPIELNSIVLLSLQAVWTGSPVGVLNLQATNYPSNQSSNIVTTWTNITLSDVDINGPSNTLYNLSEMGYNRLRLVYTRTSGTGTLTVTANGKGM